MTVLIILVYLGVAAALTMFEDVRNAAYAILDRVQLNAQLATVAGMTAIRRLLAASIIVIGVWTGLFLVTIYLNAPWYTFALLILMQLLLFPFMYTFLGLSMVMGFTADGLNAWGMAMRKAPLAVTVNPELTDGGIQDRVLAFLATCLSFVANIFYVPVGFAVSGTGTIMAALADQLKVGKEVAIYASRVIAFIGNLFFFMMAIQWWDLQRGTHLLDSMMVATIALALFGYLFVARLGDWMLGLVGIPPLTSMLPWLLGMALIGISLYAHIDPSVADGVGKYAQNFHDSIARRLNVGGAENLIPNSLEYSVTGPIMTIFNKDSSGRFVPRTDLSRFPELQQRLNKKKPLLEIGHKGYLPGELSAPIIVKDKIARPVVLIDLRPISDESARTIDQNPLDQGWVYADLIEVEGGTKTAAAPTTQKQILPVISQSVQISPDGNTCELTVPTQVAIGVRCVDDTGRKFRVYPGDELTITADGSGDIGRGIVGPNGEPKYCDKTVDSPFNCNVGGIEMWTGDSPNAGNRYFVGSGLSGNNFEGVPTLRTIESLHGYTDGNVGGYFVVLRKAPKNTGGKTTKTELVAQSNGSPADTKGGRTVNANSATRPVHEIKLDAVACGGPDRPPCV